MPVPRVTPDDVANVVLFLASERLDSSLVLRFLSTRADSSGDSYPGSLRGLRVNQAGLAAGSVDGRDRPSPALSKRTTWPYVALPSANTASAI
jgi:hypothetical protein